MGQITGGRTLGCTLTILDAARATCGGLGGKPSKNREFKSSRARNGWTQKKELVVEKR